MPLILFKRDFMKKMVLGLSMALLLSGCASSGTKISQYQLDELVKGRTTSSEVIERFGPPTSVTQNSDGTQAFGWGYAYVGFAGIGTEVESVSVLIGQDGTVSSYTRSGSTVGGATSTYAAPAPVTPGPLSKSQYKQIQLQKLTDQNLPYDEYQKRYKEIMAQ